MRNIPVIDDLEEYRYAGYARNPNKQVIYKFENGFGASVILGQGSYGLEMMLSTPEWDFDEDFIKSQLLQLDSDLYNDVVGHMDKMKMEYLLKGIKNLKPFLEIDK